MEWEGGRVTLRESRRFPCNQLQDIALGRIPPLVAAPVSNLQPPAPSLQPAYGTALAFISPMDDPRLTVLTRLMDVAMQRQQVHAANLANINTPGYKARALEFEEEFNAALDEQGLDRAMRVETQVTTPLATGADPDGNDVSSEREVAALARNKLLYDTYVTMARGKMRMLNTAISAAPGG
jgi:flagellar basal-body rod protein FlgB